MGLIYFRGLALNNRKTANAQHTDSILTPSDAPQHNTKAYSVIATTRLYRISPHLIIIKP